MTYFDPQDPPWGNDATGKGNSAASCVQPHADLRDAVVGFVGAVTGAGRLTLDSVKSDENAQSAAMDAIHIDGDVEAFGADYHHPVSPPAPFAQA